VRYAVLSEPVRYSAAGELFGSCLYRPMLPNPQPGLPVIQEGWELNKQVKGVTERLAHVGYVSLAVDANRSELERSPNGVLVCSEVVLGAAVAWLRGWPFVKQGIVGSIGFGPGGGMAMVLATTGDCVQAAVSVYGDVAVLRAVLPMCVRLCSNSMPQMIRAQRSRRLRCCMRR
jgi:dienelactone hydrolase